MPSAFPALQLLRLALLWRGWSQPTEVRGIHHEERVDCSMLQQHFVVSLLTAGIKEDNRNGNCSCKLFYPNKCSMELFVLMRHKATTTAEPRLQNRGGILMEWRQGGGFLQSHVLLPWMNSNVYRFYLRNNAASTNTEQRYSFKQSEKPQLSSVMLIC